MTYYFWSNSWQRRRNSSRIFQLWQSCLPVHIHVLTYEAINSKIQCDLGYSATSGPAPIRILKRCGWIWELCLNTASLVGFIHYYNVFLFTHYNCMCIQLSHIKVDIKCNLKVTIWFLYWARFYVEWMENRQYIHCKIMAGYPDNWWPDNQGPTVCPSERMCYVHVCKVMLCFCEVSSSMNNFHSLCSFMTYDGLRGGLRQIFGLVLAVYCNRPSLPNLILFHGVVSRLADPQSQTSQPPGPKSDRGIVQMPVWPVCPFLNHSALLWQKEASDIPSKSELLMFSYFT